jgi:glycosyltransferase involved in cell wall biosynthesis
VRHAGRAVRPGTILQLTAMTSTKYGALEEYFREVVSHSRRAGFRTVLQYQALPKAADYLRDLEMSGARVHVRPIGIGPLSAFRDVLRVVGSVRSEIVHAHFAESFAKLWIPLLGRLFGAKRILTTVHNLPEYTRRTPARFVYAMYDKVLAVSEAVRRELLTGGVSPASVDTHYLGLFGCKERSPALRTELRARFRIPAEATVLACIGFDTPFKGLDTLLTAMELAGREVNELQLLLIGVDPAASSLPGLASKLGIQDRVHWAGIVDHASTFLNAADLYIQPSRYSEGLGLAILEAMAMGLPVIGTRVGGIVEAVADGVTGTIADADVAGLAAAMLEMASRRGEWAAMGQAGQQRCRACFNGFESVGRLVSHYYCGPLERNGSASSTPQL